MRDQRGDNHYLFVITSEPFHRQHCTMKHTINNYVYIACMAFEAHCVENVLHRNIRKRHISVSLKGVVFFNNFPFLRITRKKHLVCFEKLFFEVAFFPSVILPCCKRMFPLVGLTISTGLN